MKSEGPHRQRRYHDAMLPFANDDSTVISAFQKGDIVG